MCGGVEANALGRRLNRHQGLRPRRATGVTTTVVKCKSCGLIYANPRPRPVTLGQHYDVSPEHYWSVAHLAPESGGTAEHYVATFRRLWDGEGVPVALDVGAGLGHSMQELQRRGFEVFGLEPSPAFRDRAIAEGADSGRLQLATIEDADYEPARFDLLAFSAVLEHLQDPAVALERSLRWLKPGGLVYVEVPSARWLIARMLNLYYRALSLGYVTNLSPMHPPYHLYEFTPDAFVGHGRRAGYDLVESRFWVCRTFLPSFAAPIATRIMSATGTGMDLEVWLRPSSPAA
jgi:SAM-dependent methyltransferase